MSVIKAIAVEGGTLFTKAKEPLSCLLQSDSKAQENSYCNLPSTKGMQRDKFDYEFECELCKRLWKLDGPAWIMKRGKAA